MMDVADQNPIFFAREEVELIISGPPPI
jgi:hypothetical protein